jgi:hypothetical protein
MRKSEIFRAHQRPDEINEQKGGDGAAQGEIEHGSDLSAKSNETDQKRENDRRVGDRDQVSHSGTSFWKRDGACLNSPLKSHSQSRPAA